MDTSVAKDQSKSNDVKSDMMTDDVTHSNDLLNSPNFLRIPLKPIEQRPADELINEKRFVNKKKIYRAIISCNYYD